MAKTDDIKKVAETEGKDNEVVTMTRGQLQGLIADMISKAGQPKKLSRVNDHFATLRFYEGDPIVGYGQVREVKENGEKIAYMNIYPQGAKEPIKVRYIDFLNESNFVKVQIVKQEAKKIEINHGEFMTQNLNAVYDKKFSSEMADDIETKFEYMCVVKVLDGESDLYKELAGKEFKVPATALNA